MSAISSHIKWAIKLCSLLCKKLRPRDCGDNEKGNSSQKAEPDWLVMAYILYNEINSSQFLSRRIWSVLWTNYCWVFTLSLYLNGVFLYTYCSYVLNHCIWRIAKKRNHPLVYGSLRGSNSGPKDRTEYHMEIPDLCWIE